MYGYFKEDRKIKKLIKEFDYLTYEYGMTLIETYLKGSFPYAIWSNEKKNIKVVFDFTDDNPMHIFIYEADDIAMYSYKEYVDELIYQAKSNKDVDGYINFAAQKFYTILKNDKNILE